METTRAQQVESSLQQQISSLLSNTDPAVIDSIAELVTSFGQNGATVTAALNAAVARITQLEQTVAAGSESSPVD